VSKKTANETDSTIGDMAGSAMETVSDGLSGLTNNGSGGAAFSYNFRHPEIWQIKNNSLINTVYAGLENIFNGTNAYAGTLACSKGNISVTFNPSNPWTTGTTSDFYALWAFNNCEGNSLLFETSGSVLHHWGNMNGTTNPNKITNTTVFEQAPVDKKFTNTGNGRYITVLGNGNIGQISSAALGESSPVNIAHKIVWSNLSPVTYTLDIDLTRTGYTSGGVQLWQHAVRTTTPLTIVYNSSASTRSINGTVSVTLVKAGITASVTYTNFVFDVANCQPVANSTLTITISGNRTGSGTITYNGDGTADYTYTGSKGGNESGTFEINGCGLK